MQHAIDAIYENGTFRPIHGEVLPIAEGQWVRISIDDEGEPEALRIAMSVYEGLSHDDINAIEEIALNRGSSSGSPKKLSDFFRESPLVGIELDLTRD